MVKSLVALISLVPYAAIAQPRARVTEGQTRIVLPDTVRYSPSEREIVRLERRRSAAIASHDTVWLATLYASDFQGVAANGQRVDRATLFRLFSRDNPGARFEIDELAVRELAPGTSTVTGRLVTLAPDSSVAAESRYLHVYIRRQGQWWIVAAEGSPVPPKQRAVSARGLYAQHDSSATVARKNRDWASYRAHVAAIDSIMNAHPLTTLALARAAANVGDTAAALQLLRDFTGTGITRDISSDSAFFSLHESVAWRELLRQMDESKHPIGKFEVAFTSAPADFIAEDIAYDRRGNRFLVTSIRHRKIVAITRDGRATDLLPQSAGEWGVLAVAIDSARSRVWATTYAVPLMIGYARADSGKSAVVRMNLETGAIEKRYVLPIDGKRHEPGDIAVAENGDVFISDGASGTISVIRRGEDSLAVLVPVGEFISPQGPALARDGKHLYVADYSRGIAEVDRTTGRVRWLTHARSIALNGIDGLVAAGVNSLIAVQNGSAPNRVLQLAIDPSAARVLTATVIAQDPAVINEPTHGVLVSGEFYFIANAGFGAFAPDGSLKPGVTPSAPVVMRISIH